MYVNANYLCTYIMYKAEETYKDAHLTAGNSLS